MTSPHPLPTVRWVDSGVKMRAIRLAAPIGAAGFFLSALCAAPAQTQGAPAPSGVSEIPGLPTITPSGITAATGLAAEQPAAIAIDLEKFKAWRDDFRKRAIDGGISAKTFDLALGKVTPNPAIIQADQKQPETTRAIWDYLDSAVSDKRIARGKEMLAANEKILRHVNLLYGVTPRFVVAIWGIESNYGSNIGGYNVFEALATIAYQGRRTTFAERELMAALKIADRGDKEPSQMLGSWAGAMGQTQFLPSTYLQFAVDDDGDGHRDLFASIPDILASTANFLAKWEWRTGEGWGEEVKIPAKFDYSAADPTILLPMKRWRELGLRDLKGARVSSSLRQGALFLPAGHKGPAFLLRDNFRTLLRYNNSTAYGLAIGLLADRLKGAPPVAHSWPRDERPLTLDERRELQEALSRLGYQVGQPDGILGSQTRLAIKAYQKKIGQPADGFATVALLERLRQESSAAAATTPTGATPAAASPQTPPVN